jgi:phage terminase Nu1 subunit (DNA packaging protein)
MSYEEISIREFGRRVGESDTMIRNHIAAGKIGADAVGKNPKNGRPFIFYELAYKYYAAIKGLDPTPPVHDNKQQTTTQIVETIEESCQEGEKKMTKIKGDQVQDKGYKKPPVPVLNPDAINISSQYAHADLREKKAKAELAELKLAEQRGSLVNKAVVKKVLYEFGSALRNQILSVPDRVIDVIYSASDRAEAHRILTVELNEALSRLADADNLKFNKEKLNSE